MSNNAEIFLVGCGASTITKYRRSLPTHPLHNLQELPGLGPDRLDPRPDEGVARTLPLQALARHEAVGLLSEEETVDLSALHLPQALVRVGQLRLPPDPALCEVEAA